MFPVRLVGDRVVLREWRSSEVDGVHRWLGDPQTNRFLSWGASNREESAAHLAEILDAQDCRPRREFYLAVELSSVPGITIGGAGFIWVGDDIGEIGYFLEPEYWGRGLATEAAELVLSLVFDLEGSEVVATCDAQNAASESVMRHLGLGLLPHDDERRRKYGIGREAWPMTPSDTRSPSDE